MAQPVANTEATYEEIEVIAHGDIRAPEPKEKWHTLANDIRLLNEGPGPLSSPFLLFKNYLLIYVVITRNPEGEGYGLKGKTWETVRGNFAAAAGLSDKPPSVQALKRRLGTLIKAKRHSLKIYKSGNEEQYDEIDKLLEEYIELEDSTNARLESSFHIYYFLLLLNLLFNRRRKKQTTRRRRSRRSTQTSTP